MSFTDKRNALDLCEQLLSNGYNFTEVATNYLERKYHVYKLWLNKLISKGIIQRNDSYSTGNETTKAYCKSYRIGMNYFNNETETIVVSGINHIFRGKLKYEFFGYRQPIKKSKDMKVNKTIECLSQLTIDLNKLTDVKKIILNDILRNTVVLSVNDVTNIKNIQVRKITIDNGDIDISKEYWINPNKYIQAHQESTYNLIRYKNVYFIGELATVIAYKQANASVSFDIAINKIKNQDFFANRNDTNNRLDSTITSLHGKITDSIARDNNLVQYDLANSQFAILANIMASDKSNDIIATYNKFDSSNDFYIHATAGTLYEHMVSKYKELTGIELSRSDMKVVMFEIAFGSNQKTVNKEIFASIFPDAFSYITTYKTKYGYSNSKKKIDGVPVFSVLLQRFESNIFIDNILSEIYKNKMFALSKHDSILCKEQDAVKVKSIIDNIFDRMNFKGTIK